MKNNITIIQRLIPSCVCRTLSVLSFLALSFNAVASVSIAGNQHKLSQSMIKDSIVAKHGALSINEGKLVNEKLRSVSFAGPSLFWSNNGWGGQPFYNKQVIDNITSQWNASIVRAAMGVDNNGSYLKQPQDNLNAVETVIEAAVANGIYVIVDWHSHHAEDNVEQAVAFFSHIANKYGHLDNIIYEIYNEPLPDTDWERVIKPYSLEVISAIRKIDKDNVIIVGTQSWSQDVDIVINNPIKNYKNLAYALHFYAGTHKESLRKKAQLALDAGLALFVSEWGTVDANGNGDIDYDETEKWLKFMKKNKLSHCGWSISQKNESSSMIKANVSPTSKWTEKDLTENGLFLKKIISSWPQTTTANP